MRETMQQMWHCLVNISFGYLGLIAVARISQELSSLLPYRKPEKVL
jgi:hypothetical protein